LTSWVATVTQAEQTWKYGGDRRAADLLARAGPTRSKDAQKLIARWCDEDWTKTKTAGAKAAGQDDADTATLEIDRFLKKVHEGGSHKEEAQFLQSRFQAEIDFPELKDRVDSLRIRAPDEAVAAIEAFLAKPHAGGAHRDEARKWLGDLKEESKRTVF